MENTQDHAQAMRRLGAWCRLYLHMSPDDIDMDDLLAAHELWVEQKETEGEQMLTQLRMQAVVAHYIISALSGESPGPSALFPSLFPEQQQAGPTKLDAETIERMQKEMTALVEGHIQKSNGK